MTEKRILIPWGELSDKGIKAVYEKLKAGDVYNAYCVMQTFATRPITPDDIRSGVRDSSEQFSDAEKQEIWETMTNEHLVKSGRIMATIRKVLDISLRPAPEPDPWYVLEQAISAVLMNCSEHLGGDELALAKAWNRFKAACKEDKG